MSSPSCTPGGRNGQPGGLAAVHPGRGPERLPVAAGWSLWAKNGIPDPYGIEQGGVVLNGSWYGLCGMPLSAGPDANFELIDTGGRGVVYGFIQHPYRVAVTLSSAGERLPLSSVLLHGTTFFIARLPRSACSYHAMTLRARESQGPAWSGSST
jgi:hypothetical protein